LNQIKKAADWVRRAVAAGSAATRAACQREQCAIAPPLAAAMSARPFDTPRYLAVLPLFSDLDDARRQRLAQDCRLQRLARGEHVFRAGEPCNEFHVVVTGQVRLYARAAAAQEKVVELIGPGSSFAEALMFTDRPYLVSAQALEETLVLSIGKAAVVGEILREPRVALRMLAGVSRRLHDLVRDLQSLSLHSAQQRVIGYLLRSLSEDAQGAVTVTLPANKATLASRLSLTPEYFSRVLHELAEAGLIRVDRREIHITDVQGLSRHGAT
jgi:CRP/FNR family transcriptional regulator, dissimilatory nitrate respiration regulator